MLSFKIKVMTKLITAVNSDRVLIIKKQQLSLQSNPDPLDI